MSPVLLNPYGLSTAAAPLILDTFTRTAGSLGTTEIGSAAWTELASSWGTNGSKAIVDGSPAAVSMAVVDTGLTQYAIEATFSDGDVAGGRFRLGGLAFRVNNLNQGWAVSFSEKAIYTVNSGYFQKVAGSGSPVPGDVIRVEVYSTGNTILKINGTTVVSYSESWQLASTKVGMVIDSGVTTWAKFDSFAVYALP